MTQRNLIFFITLFMMSATSLWAKTLIVEGKLDGTVTVKKDVTFSADQTLSKFTYQFSVPSVYDNSGALFSRSVIKRNNQ